MAESHFPSFGGSLPSSGSWEPGKGECDEEDVVKKHSHFQS